MITVPDRLAEVEQSLERGERVDWGKVQVLQAIDYVRLGRQFVEEAIKRQEEMDEQLYLELRPTANRS